MLNHSIKQNGFMLFFVLCFLTIPIFIKDNYYLHVIILFFFYTVIATGWNILGGYAGQVSFGHTLFFGVGAYTAAILNINYHISPWIGMLAGMIISGLTALLIGFSLFRLKGHYFAIGTMAMGGIATIIGLNWEFLGASVGLYLPIEEYSFTNFQFGNDKKPYYYIAMLLALIGLGASRWISYNRPGFYFRAIRENGDAAASLGVNILKYKQIAFVISSMIVSMAGTFYTQYYLYVNPEGVLSSDISNQMVLMAVLGGVGTIVGPIIGAAFLVPVSEAIRVIFGEILIGIDQVFYALIIILVCILQPRGIIGFFEKKKSRKSSKRKGEDIVKINLQKEVPLHE